jgi:hypothetical protein
VTEAALQALYGMSKLLDIEEPTQGKQRKKRKGSSLKTSL